MEGNLVIQLLSPYSGLTYPLVFILFFAAVAAAASKKLLRPLFLLFLLSGILVSGAMDVTVPPFTNLNKYTETVDRKVSFRVLYLEDSQGRELRVDGRALMGRSTRVELFKFLENRSTLREVAGLVVSEAQSFRQRMGRDSLAFPPPTRAYRWNSSLLEKYSELERIEISRRTVSFHENSYQVQNVIEETVFEVSPGG